MKSYLVGEHPCCLRLFSSVSSESNVFCNNFARSHRVFIQITAIEETWISEHGGRTLIAFLELRMAV